MTSFAHYPSLNDMPVVISGGATGIGAALVRNFAAQGAKVGFVDIAEEAGNALAGELTGLGQTVSFVRCDITDTAAYQAAIASLAAAPWRCPRPGQQCRPRSASQLGRGRSRRMG